MFSAIFGKKKHSPDTPEADPIPGPDTSSPNLDDFTIVDNKGYVRPAPPAPNLPSMPPYPPVGAYNRSNSSMDQGMYQTLPSHYVRGVPFKLSPEIRQGDAFEMAQLELDGILAIMTKLVQLDTDYDFSVERQVISQ